MTERPFDDVPFNERRGHNTLAYVIGGLVIGLGLLAFLLYDGPPKKPTYEYVCQPGHVLIAYADHPRGNYACVVGHAPERREVK